MRPDILMIVLSDGDGAAWQAGPWSVTRSSGAAIAVRSVHRESLPVGAPYYDIGYGRLIATMCSRWITALYLSLAENIGGPDLLRVRGPQGVDLTLPFNDRYLETPVVHLNQVGYNPHASKRYAYVSGWMGDGGALSLANFPDEAEILADDGYATVVQRVPVTVGRSTTSNPMPRCGRSTCRVSRRTKPNGCGCGCRESACRGPRR